MFTELKGKIKKDILLYKIMEHVVLKNVILKNEPGTLKWEIIVPRDVYMCSDFLRCLIGETDENVEEVDILIGDTTTSEMTQNAVDALTKQKELVDLMYTFDNPPDEGVSVKTLKTQSDNIKKIYEEWETISSKNEIYDWLKPTNEILKTMYEYKNEISPAGWLSKHSFSDDPSLDFIEHCKKNRDSLARWMTYIEDVDISKNDDYAFRYTCVTGNLSLSKFIYEKGGGKGEGFDGLVDISVFNEEPLRLAKANRNTETVKWLNLLT